MSPCSMPMIPSSPRAGTLCPAASAVIAGLITLSIAACSLTDTVGPPDPASVTSVSLTPAANPVAKGSTQALALSALDSAGRPVTIKANWTTSAPLVATVSGDGVVSGVGYGPATITATVGTHSASASIVVTAAPVARTYSILDLGASLQAGSIVRQLSDSGDVAAGTYYRQGVATTIPGCSSAVTINGPGHVLCRKSVYDSVSTFAIWRDGALEPLAATDTFKAGDFRAFVLSDSDEVAGMFWRPSFVNAGCPAAGDRCLAVWKNGAVTFPGYTAPTDDAMLMNSRQQIALEQPAWAPSSPGLSSVIIDLATGGRTAHVWGIHALNDNGWAAIQQPYLSHGSTNTFGSTAYVMTPASLVPLGNGGATGINNANVVVGTLDVGPFIWRGDGVALLTNAVTDPAWTITAADEINNRGQILATADNTDGRKAHTVLLTPVQP